MKTGAHPSNSPTATGQTLKPASGLHEITVQNRPEERPTYVYFIATLDRSKVKIGSSCNPAKRFIALRTASPFPLELIALAHGSLMDERVIQTAFLQHRSHGEWFHGHPDILALISEIAKTRKIPEQYLGGEWEPSLLWRTGPRSKRTPEELATIRETRELIEAVRAMNALNPNSFLLHAGRRMESVPVAGGVSPPASSPIICGRGSNFISGGAA